MPKFLALLLAVCSSYPLFWLQSFDAEYRVRVYSERDINGPNALEVDDRPSWLSAGAALWAVAFGIVYAYSPGQCAMDSVMPLSTSTVFGVACIAITAKALFGAAAANHKRLLLESGTNLSRPLPWRALDVLTPIPVNLTVVPLTKLIWFPIFGAAAWALNGFQPGDSDWIVPDYAFLAGSFLLLGRLSSMYLKRTQIPLGARLGANSRSHHRGAMLATIAFVCTASFFLTTTLIEEVLEGCGAAPRHLPSYSMLVVGLTAMPFLAMIGSFCAALVGTFIASQSSQ